MWGGGFLKAVNADQDKDLEVMAFGLHERKASFYLDYSEGQIKKRLYDAWPDRAKDLVKSWRTVHVDLFFGVILLIFPVIAFYMLYGLVLAVCRLVRKRRSKKFGKGP
jgi:hypothetical protein